MKKIKKKGIIEYVKVFERMNMKFLKNVKTELKKVKWPDKKYMTKYTVATIVFVLFLTLFFFGVSALVAFLQGLLNG